MDSSKPLGEKGYTDCLRPLDESVSPVRQVNQLPLQCKSQKWILLSYLNASDSQSSQHLP